MRVEKFVILSFMEGMAISKKMVVSLAFNDPVRKVISNKLEMSYLLVYPFFHTGAIRT